MTWWHIALLALPILPNMWSIWHVRNHEFATEQEKSLWFLLGVFVPVIGGIVYFCVGRRRALAQTTAPTKLIQGGYDE